VLPELQKSLANMCILLMPSLTPCLSHMCHLLSISPKLPKVPARNPAAEDALSNVVTILSFALENLDNVTTSEGRALKKSIRDQTVDLPGFEGIYSDGGNKVHKVKPPKDGEKVSPRSREASVKKSQSCPTIIARAEQAGGSGGRTDDRRRQSPSLVRAERVGGAGERAKPSSSRARVAR
jgi:hypothetical protein